MKTVYFVRGVQHAIMARTSIESVLRQYPRSRVMVMTDDADSEALRQHLHGAPLYAFERTAEIMVANIDAQLRAVLWDFHPDEAVLFLDADVLVTGDVLEPYREDVDLVATWRDHVGRDESGEAVVGIAALMPYNYGVLIGRCGLGLVEALMWMRERVRGMGINYQRWYGNQTALAALMGRTPPTGEPVRRRLVWDGVAPGNEIVVAAVPCEQYNYTPELQGEEIGQRRALHFKGHSRGLFAQYAKRLDLPFEGVP